jgi:excisionase family DNA binding protein
MPPDTQQLLTLREVADDLKVSVDRVRRLVWSRELEAHRVGGQLRISTADLAAFLYRCRQDPLRPLSKKRDL